MKDRDWVDLWYGLVGVLVLSIPLVAGGVVLHKGWDRAKAYFVGQSGQVAPFNDCRWVDRYEYTGDKDAGWECRGVFTGGGLRVNNVRIVPRPADRPTGPVPAIVSGPSATEAWTTSGVDLLFPTIAGVVMASITPGLALHFYRAELAGVIGGWRRRRRLRGELGEVQHGLGDLHRDLDDLQREIDDLRRKLDARTPAERGGEAGVSADRASGPESPGDRRGSA